MISKSSRRQFNLLRPKGFRFIDLFAGIGGIRRGFEAVGGECVFTSERDKFAVQTYKANYQNCPDSHTFNEDIRDVTLSELHPEITEEVARLVNEKIPDHDVLLAGFPCQPFSVAGVSSRNGLGRAHGFECQTQGTLFFDVARIIGVKKPAAFVLENVKNLKSHDKGNTFRVITETLDKLGYHVADVDHLGPHDPKVVDGRHYLPQHRERIVLVGFRKDLNVHHGFTLRNLERPASRATLHELLEKDPGDRYTLTTRLWDYLRNRLKEQKAKGNGFGYGMVDPQNPEAVTRTLSARYHKDGSEILLYQGEGRNPRRLTPRECARLMGFDAPNEENFQIPVSDTQAYRQFGNSVIVPVFEAVARLMRCRISVAMVQGWH